MGPESLSTSHNLNFNHPVKELIWVCRNKKAGTEATDLTTQGSNTDGVNNLSSVSESNWAFDFFNFVCPDRTNVARTEVIGGNKSYEPFEFARLTFNGIDRFTKEGLHILEFYNLQHIILEFQLSIFIAIHLLLDLKIINHLVLVIYLKIIKLNYYLKIYLLLVILS